LIATADIISDMSHLPIVIVTPPIFWLRRELITTMSRHQLNPTKKARLGEEKKNEDKNNKVPKKDGSDRDLKAAHQSNDDAKKEDDRKPAAEAKKVDDTTPKLKDPPRSPLTKRIRQTTRNQLQKKMCKIRRRGEMQSCLYTQTRRFFCQNR
jgi:hypothetical protein